MKAEILGYSSVKGMLHEQKNTPNQDSYIVKKYKFGTVMVVSDGLGSHKFSDIGSQAVCRSVCQAIQLWNQYKEKDIRLLIPLIHSLWSMEVYPYSKKECGATCLFAFVSNENKLYAGQLGDGNIYISIDDDISLLQIKEDDFSNFTSGMSGISSFNEWSLKEYDIKGKKLRFCMMTDGVSETLVEKTKLDFLEMLWKKVRSASNLPARNRLVYKLLKNWNPVNSGDDRTLVYYEIK